MTILQTTTHTAPLVGMRFHPPANAILQCLPAGAPLILVPEPENPFDPNAIKVMVRADAIPTATHEVFATLLSGFGYTLDDFFGPVPDDTGAPTLPTWSLGHVKANNNQDAIMSSAAIMAPLMAGASVPAVLRFDMAGLPLVEAQLPIAPASDGGAK